MTSCASDVVWSCFCFCFFQGIVTRLDRISNQKLNYNLDKDFNDFGVLPLGLGSNAVGFGALLSVRFSSGSDLDLK